MAVSHYHLKPFTGFLTAMIEAGKKDIAKRQTASEYLKQLASSGVLQEVQAGKEKLLIHPRLIRLLTQDASAVEVYG